MKKIFYLIICLLIVVVLTPKKVSADMFDKPTAVIEIIGIDQPYKFEVLIPGSISNIHDEDLEFVLRNYYDEEYPYELFKDYKDSDGYVSRTLYNGGAPANIFKTDKNTFKLGYYRAPEKFKIAIVLADNTIITSEIINRTMFHSKMKYDLTNVDFTKSTTGVGKVTEQVPIGKMSYKFVIRVVATILIELGILFLFMFRLKNSFKLAAITNLITQTILTIFLFYGYYVWASGIGAIVVLILGEFGVLVTEMIVYVKLLKEKGKKRALSYAIVANLSTFIISLFTISFI